MPFFRESTRTSDVLAASNASRNNTLSNMNRANDNLLPPQQSNTRRINHQKKMAPQKTYDHADDDDLDYAIDTSALHKALPDFSDGRSNDEEEEDDDDDDDDISIEIGRGRQTEYRLDDSRESFMSVDEDSRQQSVSPAGARHEARQSNHGARLPLQNISNRTRRNSRTAGDELRKNAQIRRASQVSQKENVDPRAQPKSRNNQATTTGQQQGSKLRRRTLSDMHAKVAETYDGSYLSDERPNNTHMTAKSTRFGYAKPYDQKDIAEAVNRASSGAYADDDGARSTRRPQKNNTWTDHDSFALPDVENLSELVSGIYHDGSLQNARQVRPRTTRFTSPPAVSIPESQQAEYAHFDRVPIPEDEKAIFASLRLLQRKVSSLEKDNADAEAKLEELRKENTILRAEHSRRQSNKSQVSGRDEDEGAKGGTATLAVEKNRLEAANAALQDQLEAARRKLSGHASSVHNAKHERNSLVNQLGTAYLGYQELKTDNEDLRRENEELKAQLEELTGVPLTQHSGPDQTRTKERPSQSRAEGVDDVHHTTRRTVDEQRRGKDYDRDDALFSLDFPSRRASEKKDRNTQKSQTIADADKKLPNTSRQRSRKFSQNVDAGTEFDMTMDARELRGENVTKDMTYLSFIDSREIAQLRKTLEQERVARKNRRARGEPERTTDFTTKSLFNNVTRRSTKSVAETTKHSANVDLTERTDGMTTGNQDFTSHKENLTRASSRKDPTAPLDDATSAFILPDITMHGAGPAAASTKAGEDIQLSAAAQRALDRAVGHERANCTFCTKGASAGNDTNGQSIEIPKITPVSMRAHLSGAAGANAESNEDHTQRPSQPPAAALAKVLKMLEDELAHLKMQLTVCQSRYSRHDAAAGKRKRVRLGEQMKVLMTEIENRSEVVYSLYDVLEGQKEAKQNDEAGVDEGEAADDDEDDELPWEGFESTDDVTGMSRRRL